MPVRDSIHEAIVEALETAEWIITADPFVLVFEQQHLFIDLSARASERVRSQWIGAERGTRQIAVEIKSFPGESAVTELYRAIGQFVVYNLVLQEVDPQREVFLAVSLDTFEGVFAEPLGQLVLQRLPLRMIVVDLENKEVVEWIEPKNTATM